MNTEQDDKTTMRHMAITFVLVMVFRGLEGRYLRHLRVSRT